MVAPQIYFLVLKTNWTVGIHPTDFELNPTKIPVVQFGQDGYAPFGMDTSCYTNDRDDRMYDGWVDVTSESDDVDYMAGVAGAALNQASTVADLTEILREGMNSLAVIETVDPSWGSGGNSADSVYGSTCEGCHPTEAPQITRPEAAAPLLADIVPTMGDEKLRDIITHGSGAMPAQPFWPNATPLTPAQIDGTIAKLRELYPPAPRPLVEDGSEAMALLLAYNIVDNIVEEAMGGRFTLDHGFARNQAQSDLHTWLVSQFVEDGWSLRTTLRQLVLSEAFNRHAPVDSALDYDLPMVANPWAAAAPYEAATAEQDANSVGDHVYRYSVPNLFHSVAQALHWPAPLASGDNSYANKKYPTRDQMVGAGRYLRAERLGVDDATFATVLSWEDTIHGCEKPVHVYGRDVPYPLVMLINSEDVLTPAEWEDWIDIASEQADGEETIEDVIIAMKDRLITDPTLTQAEIGHIEDLFGAAITETYQAADDERALRQFCGVLTKSPQFMLGGIGTHAGLPVDPPAFIPCSDGLCTYSDLYLYYEEDLCELGIQGPNCAVIVDPGAGG